MRWEKKGKRRGNALGSFFFSVQRSVPSSRLYRTVSNIRQIIQPRCGTGEQRTLTIPPTKQLPMIPHHIQPSQILNTRIVAVKTQHLLFHDERLDVRGAEGGVEAEGRGRARGGRIGRWSSRKDPLRFRSIGGEYVWASVDAWEDRKRGL